MSKGLIRHLQVSTESFSAFKFIAPLNRFVSQTGRYEGSIACNMREYADAASYRAELERNAHRVHHVPIPRRINPIKDLLAIISLVRMLRSDQPTILHTHTSKAGILGRIAGSLARVPVIVHTAYDFGHIRDVSGVWRWLYIFVEKLAARLCDCIFVIHADGLNDAKRFGIADEDLIVNTGVGLSFTEFDLSNVTDATRMEVREKWNLPSDRPLVGTLARLVPHKGVDVLLRAIPRVLHEVPDAYFVIAGGGEKEGQLRKLAADLGIAESVTFTGFLKEQRLVPTYMSLLDVFWLATKWEGFGLVYPEANAMGTPVVGSDIPPVDYVIGRGVGGILADPESPEEFGEACVTLLRDEELRSQMASAGARRARHLFNEDDVSARVVQVYDRLTC